MCDYRKRGYDTNIYKLLFLLIEMMYNKKTAIANATAEIIMDYLKNRIIFLISFFMCLLGTINNDKDAGVQNDFSSLLKPNRLGA